jgi:hypothetical protein
VEGVGSVTDTPPTAEAAWRDFSGSLGLYRQSDAPGDLTRCYLSDADTTRAGQMTAWPRWSTSSDTVAVDLDSGGRAVKGVQALVNAAGAWGFVGSPDNLHWSYWLWNGTKFAFQRDVQGQPSNPAFASLRAPNALTQYTGSTSFAPVTIVQQTGTNLWMPIVPGGSTDISVAAAAGVGVNATHNYIYFDILFSLIQGGGNLAIVPYRPTTPATANVLNAVTYAGLAPSGGVILGEGVCLGVVACEGAVYIATDRSVYAMQWNDQTNTVLTTKLLELPRLTGAPVVWNGEVYIPADNRIVHIVPSQRGYDWRTPDPTGVLPGPFNGTIIHLTPSPDALFAVVNGSDTAGNVNVAILRMDSNGIWSCPFLGSDHLVGAPIPLVDGANSFALALLNTAGTTATVLPLPASGRNPRLRAVSQRAQRAGPFRTITPWFDLESETAQKQLERFRTAVLNASATFPIRVSYQTDYADEQSADTFTTGCAKGTGAWHPCGYFAQSVTPGHSGSTDANGNGAVWWEFDGATNYPNSVGVLPAYPTFKRVRWCLEINGDTTGTTVPTLLSHAFHRLEYVTKAYERDITIRIRVGETQGAAQSPVTTVTYPTSASVVAAKNAVKALNSAKAVCTYVDETGTSQVVTISKYQASLTSIQADGTPGEYVLNLSLMDVPLTGQN